MCNCLYALITTANIKSMGTTMQGVYVHEETAISVGNYLKKRGFEFEIKKIMPYQEKIINASDMEVEEIFERRFPGKECGGCD